MDSIVSKKWHCRYKTDTPGRRLVFWFNEALNFEEASKRICESLNTKNLVFWTEIEDIQNISFLGDILSEEERN